MRSTHCNSTILALHGSCWSTSLHDDDLISWNLLLTLLGYCGAIHELVIPIQVLRFRSKCRPFRRISQHNISWLYHLRYPPSNPWLISPTKWLRHRMLIELWQFIIISTSKQTIAFIHNLIGFQLVLDIWKSGSIELPLWFFTRWIKRYSLLYLWL